MENIQSQKAKNIRQVIRYLQKFKNALIVIYLDEKTIDSPLFSSHIRDIALLHEAGLKVVIIPGARSRIDEVLSSNRIEWTFKDNVRIVPETAMPLIKMAAFDVSNQVMTNLAANGITALIGNWVRARAKGVINGLDYGTAGEIDRLDIESLKTVLNDSFIPIFPCIGWNSVGHPYNISSLTLAQQVAIDLKADKLFFVMQDAGNIVINNQIVPAMNLEEVDSFIEKFDALSASENCSSITNLLKLSKEACQNGVVRSHIVDGKVDGVLLAEIFSDLGSGTMIYTSNYGKIRSMEQKDIPAVLRVMRPFIENGKLLSRTEKDLAEAINDYHVYEVDGGVHGCSALHKYSDGQYEIAAVAVDDSFAHMGIGFKLVENLIEKAKNQNGKTVFILTTQAADWFEKLGFQADDIETLPEKRRKIWTEKRNSKLYRIKF